MTSLRLDPPERLGRIRVPSGILLVLDGGLLNLWNHDRDPVLPPHHLNSEEARASAEAARDFRLEGPDARAAGLAFDRSAHPLYAYDVPGASLEEFKADFESLCRDRGFQAQLVPLDQRVSHRARVDQYLENGVVENGITFHGVWAAVAPGLPKDAAVPVMGRRRSEDEEFAGRWQEVYVELRPDAEILRSEFRGYAAVDEARLILADVESLGGWVYDDSLDGLADVVFWGRDAAAAAEAAEAPPGPDQDGHFGWSDLDEGTARERARQLQGLKAQNDWLYAVDLRPHSHHWRLMSQVRRSDTESGVLRLGEAELCLFMTTWGDGLFEVYADYDASDRLARVRVLLGSEQTVSRMRKVQDRYFGEGAKLAFVSERVLEDGGCVRFLYREATDREQDSGWRVFAGSESDEELNDPKRIQLVPIWKLIEGDDSLAMIFEAPVGSVFERESCEAAFQVVTDWSPSEDEPD